MKLHLIYLTICSLSQAAYISRMALINQNQPNVNLNVNRIRPMAAFRPGVVMRPWNHPRLVPAPSHRVPFVMYRNHPHRYSMKHFPTRMATSPWKAATRQPSVTATTNAEYEFVKTASSPKTRTALPNSGAIHTIPAPNLSLAEKPIVVLDDITNFNSISTESPKAVFGLNQKHADPTKLHVGAKIEQPIGFSKANSFTPADYQSLQNSAALQLASELGLPAISLPQHLPQSVLHQQQPQQVVTQQSIPQQHVQQQHFVQQQSIVPQQFTMHNFHTLPNAQEFMQAAPDGIVITPNALYQPDPAFLQKLQNQLLERFPGVEFVPYAAGFDLTQNQNQPSQIQQQILFPAPQNQPQNNIDQQTFQSQSQAAFKPSPFQFQTAQPQRQINAQINAATQPSHNQILFQPSVTLQPNTQAPFVLLQNEQYPRQTPPSFAVAESQNRYVVQRQTQEGTVTLVPQVKDTNTTGNRVEVSTFSTPQNITIELIAAESKPTGTTIKYTVETSTDVQKTTPMQYTSVAQNGQINGYMQAALVSQIAADIIANKVHQNSAQSKQNNQPLNKNVVQANQKSESTNKNTVQVNQDNAKLNRDNAQINLNNAQANLNNAQENLNNAQANQNNAQANQNNAQTNQNNAQANKNNAQANQNNVQAKLNNAQANQNIANIENAQVAQSTGNVVTDSFYSAINDVRVGAALAQADKPQESTTQENINTTTSIPTSTINEDLKPYFVQKTEKDDQNQTNSEIKSVLGVPFAKAQNSVNVAYTLLRSDEKETKVAKDGSVYAGQIVEASVSEDQDFNKQKANLLTRRAPIRLVAVADKENITTTTRIPPRAAVIKARIPPKSKLTFDDKTGEPVLRIYASYVDTSAQKEAITSKLKRENLKEIPPRKVDPADAWKVKALARPHGFEANPNAVTQFGLKLKSRSDDYVPLFEDYEE
ncbi:hypothetical protein O0L34_g4470 [Tuta absoluta]|nr:hypothetical protein O0L34_g4470 [Tuta absoluta]